jgi:uncharacterized protein YqjF (DUF2071 family)
MPDGRPVMRMRWRHLLFAHWPIDADVLRPLVPPSLEIDTFEGRAWVGLVPFTMEDVSPVVAPRMPWRGVTDFHECNVRTYVYPRGRPDLAGGGVGKGGVWFFSLDAASRLAVWGARRFWGLPYFFARMRLHRTEDEIDYAVDRVHAGGVAAARLRCRWRALDPLPAAQPGELAHFLTERYCLYTTRRTRGDESALQCGPIAHAPWPLRRAQLLSLDNSLVRAAGIDGLDQSHEPLLYHADELEVRAWRLRPILT